MIYNPLLIEYDQESCLRFVMMDQPNYNNVTCISLEKYQK
jgi:hypothetical protein